jgi:uncharacterized RDD family membrane protein YckC
VSGTSPTAGPASESAPRAAKPSVLSRVLAKMVDILFVLALAAVLPYPLGPVAGFLYSLVADGIRLPGLRRGQSIGKKLFKLQVVSVVTHDVSEPGSGGLAEAESLVHVRHPATVRDSVLRNAPVGVATFFAIIPVWGWLILGLIGVPLMIMEIYLMVTVETGHRLGDVMGDTEVVGV